MSDTAAIETSTAPSQDSVNEFAGEEVTCSVEEARLTDVCTGIRPLWHTEPPSDHHYQSSTALN